jgi:hypothetical protein
LNIPKKVSKTKLGKEIIKKLFLFLYLSLFKEKTCKNRIFVSQKKNGEETFHIWGERCPKRKPKMNMKIK